MRGVVILLLLLFSLPASAQDAASLFAQGRERYAAGDYPRAYEAYRRAWELSPGYDIAANLGNVEVDLGKYAEAADHLAYAKRTTPASLERAKRDKIIAKIDERMSKALQHVGKVILSVTPGEATVHIDGIALDADQRDNGKFVPIGKHTITATAPQHDPLTQEITVQPGGAKPTISRSRRPRVRERAAASPCFPSRSPGS